MFFEFISSIRFFFREYINALPFQSDEIYTLYDFLMLKCKVLILPYMLFFIHEYMNL